MYRLDDEVEETTLFREPRVLPYTNYTVSVAASTSAGQGRSVSIIETSPEAGTLHIIMCAFLFNFPHSSREGSKSRC